MIRKYVQQDPAAYLPSYFFGTGGRCLRDGEARGEAAATAIKAFKEIATVWGVWWSSLSQSICQRSFIPFDSYIYRSRSISQDVLPMT